MCMCPFSSRLRDFKVNIIISGSKGASYVMLFYFLGSAQTNARKERDRGDTGLVAQGFAHDDKARKTESITFSSKSVQVDAARRNQAPQLATTAKNLLLTHGVQTLSWPLTSS